MTSRKISLDGTHQQLIEINAEAKYFEAAINVVPSEADIKKKYEIGIITQEKLDAGVAPKMSSLSGKFSKIIKVTEGDYQSYCLIIKSSEPFTDMNVQINLEEFASDEEEKIEDQEQQQRPSVDETHAMMESYIKEKEGGNKKIKYIIGALIILVGGFFLYHFWKSKSKEAVKVEAPVVEAPVSNVTELPVELPVPAPKIPINAFSFY